MDKPTNIKRTPVPVIQPKPVPEPPTTEVALLTEILIELKKMAKSQGRNSSLSDSRWLNTDQAAAWCGDLSVDYFRRLVKRYSIPRHGARKLFDKFQLNDWVLDSRCFLNDNSPSLRRRGASMAAIQNVLLAAIKDSLRDLTDSTE